MRRLPRAAGRQHERGAIAVEAAIVIPFLLVFLGYQSIVLAFYFRQYSAAQKAVHDAALYLSTAPRIEMTTTGPDGYIAAITLARKIVVNELAGVVPEGVPVVPDIYCTYRVASGTQARPCTITYTKNADYTLYEFDVGIGFNYVNPITGSDTTALIAPYVTVRYLGN